MLAHQTQQTRRSTVRNPFVAAQMRTRAMEETRAQQAQLVSDQFKVASVARWEQSTSAKIERRQVDTHAQAMREESMRQLAERRRRLAAMLAAEHEQHQKEIAASFETADERRERMVVRARELRAQNEERRQELLRRLERQRLREGCDDVRLRDSMHYTIVAARARKEQIKERMQLEESARREEQAFAEQWLRDKEERDRKAEREQRERVAREREVQALLDRQVEDLSLRRRMEAEHQQQENEMLRRAWKEEEEAQRRREVEERERNEQLRSAVLAFNATKRGQVEAIRAREAEFDRRLLQAQLLKEEAERRMEAEERRHRRDDMRAYQDALRAAMVRERQDESELERMRQESVDREWKKREDRWAAEAEARRRLWEEVDRERKYQLMLKDERAKSEAEKEAAFAEFMKEQARILEERERVEREAIVRRRVETQALVAEQIKLREQQRQVEQQELARERGQMREEEQQLERTIESLMDEAPPKQDFRRKRVSWYS